MSKFTNQYSTKIFSPYNSFMCRQVQATLN